MVTPPSREKRYFVPTEELPGMEDFFPPGPEYMDEYTNYNYKGPNITPSLVKEHIMKNFDKFKSKHKSA